MFNAITNPPLLATEEPPSLPISTSAPCHLRPRHLHPELSQLLSTAASALSPSNRFGNQNLGFAIPPLLSPPEESGGSTNSTPPLNSGILSSSNPEAHRGDSVR
ncbi:Phox-associated domain [Striga asiatica]|uniref:Phox-associated domain n=1 Tax=Striga asiatica TaxID=4170 RepID=A0A5A7PGM1_STRAF|nr:Phox-associated domain [Striga asiatica]